MAVFMNMKTLKQLLNNYISIICSGIIGGALFIYIYGARVINPLYTDWLMGGGDPTQHYLGFLLYKEAPCRFQAGMMNTAAYPFSTSVMFTDSIPLAAITGKIIGLFTDTTFQYFGLWCFVSMILMGVLSCILLRKYTDRIFVLLPASALFCLAPAMLRRIFWHTSLSSHFLLLFCLIIVSYRRDIFNTTKRTVLAWVLVSFLCIMIHMYFLAMCGMLLLLYVLLEITDMHYANKAGEVSREDKTDLIKRLIFSVIGYVATALITLWWLGGFSSGMMSDAPGLSYYSFNLNSFFSPQGYSTILPELSCYKDGQYEGFAYLGVGCILLLIIGLVIAMIGSKKFNTQPMYIVSAAIVFTAIIIMAASNELTFSDRLLVSVPLPGSVVKIWEIFRATGRLIWPAVYMLMLLGTVLVINGTNHRVAAVILTICLVLQVVDLGGIIEAKNNEFNREVKYSNKLDNPMMESMLIENALEHIVFLDKQNLSQEELYSFARFAADNGLTINDFYFARALTSPVNDAAMDFFMHPNNHSLYVVSAESAELMYMFDIDFMEYEGLFLGLKRTESE